MFNRGRTDEDDANEFANLNREQLIKQITEYRYGLHKLANEMLGMVNWQKVWWSRN